MSTDIDFDARYTVERFGGGIAFWLAGWAPKVTEVEFELEDEDGEKCFGYDVVIEDDTSQVVAVMVGDDIEHFVDVDELTKIDDDAYCAGCGQVGCQHGGR